MKKEIKNLNENFQWDLSNVVETSEVVMWSDDVCLINKRGYAIAVVKRDKFCYIMSLTHRYLKNDNLIEFIPYAYTSRSKKKVYKKWLHLIGKMCKKEVSSKYFADPRFKDHLSNGPKGRLKYKYELRIGVDAGRLYDMLTLWTGNYVTIADAISKAVRDANAEPEKTGL